MVCFRILSLVNQNDQRKPESRESGEERMLRALEIELIQERASWKKTHLRRRAWRAASFVFLFIVGIGTLFALYYAIRIMPGRTSNQSISPPSATPVR
jgi:hypothetical protein